MPSLIIPVVASAACFLALAKAAVTTPREAFRRTTSLMALGLLPLVAIAPSAGAALLAAVLFSRKLANAPVPATVPELLRLADHR